MLAALTSFVFWVSIGFMSPQAVYCNPDMSYGGPSSNAGMCVTADLQSQHPDFTTVVFIMGPCSETVCS